LPKSVSVQKDRSIQPDARIAILNGSDLGSAALRGQNIEFVTLVPSPSSSGREHGTALAALLAGRMGGDAPGLLPQAKLVTFAAPFVTAAVARLLSRQPAMGEVDVAERLSSLARDLGAPGRDPVFGWGLIQTASLCDRPPSAPAIHFADEALSTARRSISRREE
jgi:hypothetical protein